jgi:hypothetical protein
VAELRALARRGTRQGQAFSAEACGRVSLRKEGSTALL